MSHIWVNHVSHMNKSCPTYEYVTSHMWMSYVTHINESCPTYEWVMSHIWMCHVKHTNESSHTHMNESCHTFMHQSLSQVTRLDNKIWKHSSKIWNCQGNKIWNCKEKNLTHMLQMPPLPPSTVVFLWQTHIKESCLTCEWVMPCIWMRQWR